MMHILFSIIYVLNNFITLLHYLFASNFRVISVKVRVSSPLPNAVLFTQSTARRDHISVFNDSSRFARFCLTLSQSFIATQTQYLFFGHSC